MSVTQYQYKYRVANKEAAARGTVSVPLKAALSVPDGCLLGVSTESIDIFAVGLTKPVGLSIGNLTGHASLNTKRGDILQLYPGDILEGILIDAIPATWFGVAIYPSFVASPTGWRFGTTNGVTGAINLGSLFVLHSILDAAVGDVNPAVALQRPLGGEQNGSAGEQCDERQRVCDFPHRALLSNPLRGCV